MAPTIARSTALQAASAVVDSWTRIMATGTTSGW